MPVVLIKLDPHVLNLVFLVSVINLDHALAHVADRIFPAGNK